MYSKPLKEYLERQEEWSRKTFGDGPHTAGILDHIRKELIEVEQKPYDLEEWIDVMILAMDGFLRHGGHPKDLVRYLQRKQNINFAREWPPVTPGDSAVEHIRKVRIARQY
jgi:Protein of unknown function (DUF550)